MRQATQQKSFEKVKEAKPEGPKKPTELPKAEVRKSDQSAGTASSSPSDSPSTSSSPVLSDENAPKHGGEEESWQEVKTKRNKKTTRQEESRRPRNRPHRSNATNDSHHQAGSTVDTRSERSAVSVDGVEQPEEMTDSHVNKVCTFLHDLFNSFLVDHCHSNSQVQ